MTSTLITDPTGPAPPPRRAPLIFPPEAAQLCLEEDASGWWVNSDAVRELVPDQYLSDLDMTLTLPEGPYPNLYSAHTALWFWWIYHVNHDKLTISYSMNHAFSTCRMLFYWQYIADLTPAQRSLALQTGDVTHRLLDLYNRKELTLGKLRQLPELVQLLNPNNSLELTDSVVYEATELIAGYLKYYSPDTVTAVSPEVHMELDLGPYRIYTRLDGLATFHDPLAPGRPKRVRLEYKTAARKNSLYLAGYARSLQTGIAHWILEHVDPTVEGSLHRMLVKTKIPQYLEGYSKCQPWLVRRAKATVNGFFRSLSACDIHPSMECQVYNGICDYHTLCRKDTPQNRKDFYTSRKEVKKQSFQDPDKFFTTTINPNHDSPLNEDSE